MVIDVEKCASTAGDCSPAFFISGTAILILQVSPRIAEERRSMLRLYNQKIRFNPVSFLCARFRRAFARRMERKGAADVLRCSQPKKSKTDPSASGCERPQPEGRDDRLWDSK